MVSYGTSEEQTMNLSISLNPYCSGQWYRTGYPKLGETLYKAVLILIVVDNGLVLEIQRYYRKY